VTYGMYGRTYGIDAGSIHGICGPLEIEFKMVCALDTRVLQKVGTERSFITSYFLSFEWIYAQYGNGEHRESNRDRQQSLQSKKTRATNHAVLHEFIGAIHELLHLFLPGHRIFLEPRSGHPQRNVPQARKNIDWPDTHTGRDAIREQADTLFCQL